VKLTKSNNIGLSLIFIFSLSARAAFTPTAFPGETTDLFRQGEAIQLTDAEMKTQTEAALKRAKRSIASGGSEESMSPEMKKLRDAILSIKDSKALDAMLEDLNTKYTAIDAEWEKSGRHIVRGADRDFKFFAAQILPLRCLKGIAFRFLPLAEKSRIVDSKLASAMFRIGQDIQILSPQIADLDVSSSENIAKKDASQAAGDRNASRAVFDYLTQPFDGVLLFNEAYQLQAHLYNGCAVELKKAASRLEVLSLEEPIVLDNKMFFGVGTFPDDLDRYKLVGEAERHVAIAGKYAGIHFAAFFRSYRMDGYFALQVDLGKLNVVDSFPDLLHPGANGYEAVKGIGLKDRSDVIRGPKYANLFTLYSDGGKYMRNSFETLARSIQEVVLAWKEVEGKPANSSRIINPGIWNSSRDVGKTIEGWENVTRAGPRSMHSRLTDRIVKVDLQGFYNNPPNDLKALLPLKNGGFDTSSPQFIPHKFKVYVVDKNSKAVLASADRYQKYRNYFYQDAVNWDLPTYKKLFPDLTSGKDLPMFMRTAGESWGGRFQVSPIMPFLR
jgi:hypothetical protein